VTWLADLMGELAARVDPRWVLKTSTEGKVVRHQLRDLRKWPPELWIWDGSKAFHCWGGA
jgi:hypothetical protein